MPAGDGGDARARSCDDLSAREHAVDMRRHERAVDGQQSSLREQQVRAPHEVFQVRRLTDGEDDDVTREVGVVLGELRREATLRVEDGQTALKPHPGHTTVLLEHVVRTVGAERRDALVESLLDLPWVRGKLVHRFERRERHVRCTASQRNASAVHRNVAAADDQHALALDACVALPVARTQELQRTRDALRVRPRQRQDSAHLQPRGDEHGFVLTYQVVDRDVLADLDAREQPHPHRLEVGDLLGEHVARKAVRRHARKERAAGGVVLLVHVDLVALLHQVECRRQTARSATDDRHPRIARDRQRLVPATRGARRSVRRRRGEAA